MSEMKDDLRIFLKQARANLSKQRREQVNVKIMDELLGHLAPYDNVLSFASMGDEIDLWELNEALAKQGRLLLPRMEGDLLVPQPVSDLKKLEKSKYKIFEPKAGAVAKKIDCVLVPAIGFDAANHRIGYGKGHYDRFLTNIKCPTFGVGFKEQLTRDFLPREDHDISLSKVFLF